MNRLLEIGLSNALLATALAAVAIAVARVARRPALCHCLWLLVLLRLVAPPVMGVAVPGWPKVAQTRVWSHAARETEGPRVGSPRAAPVVSVSLGAKGLADFGDARGGFSADTPAWQGVTRTPRQKSAGIATREENDQRWDWIPWFGTVWVAGSVAWFAVAGVRILRFRRLLRFAEPAPAALQEEAFHLAQRLGIARCPRVSVVPVAISPLVWGLGRAVWLVLPADLLGRLGPREQAALLAHELAHLRRRDHLVRWLEIVAIGLYWWHPVAWWARREIGRAEEQCCDAWVVWSLPGAALAYAKALLKTVDFLSEARPSLPLAASGAGHVHSLKRRIAMILRIPSHHRLTWPARAGALALGLLVLPFGAQPAVRAKLADEPAESAAVIAQQPAGDQETRALETRLRRLEDKLEKLTSELSTKRASKTDRPAKDRKAAPGAQEKKADNPKPEVRRPEKKEADEEKEIDDRAEEIAQRIGDMIERLVDPEKLEDMARRIEAAVKRGFDPERLEAMGKQIEEAVKKGFDSDRLEAMGKELEDSFKNGFKDLDADSLKDLGKKVEEAIKKGIDPDRLEAMGEQIGDAIKKGLGEDKLQDRDEVKKDKPRPGEAPKPPRAIGPRSDREPRDIERRMRELERKLDRILNQLEKGHEAPAAP